MTTTQHTSTNTTDLLARYLQAVGDHLPSATREDVLAELRANLQAQLDDRAEELNRPLTDPEVAAILKDHGRPILVAARYLPQQSLIGPAIFPYYLMVLRKVTPFALLIFFLANCSNILFVHTTPELIAGILRAFGQLIPDLLIFAAWVTVAFAIAEYVYNRNQAKPFSLTWDPTRLPTVKPPFKGKSRATRIADFVFHFLWLLYVLAIPTHLYLVLGPGELYFRQFSVTFAPVWHTFYIVLLVFLVFQLATKFLALNPTFDPWKSPLDLLTKIGGISTTAILVCSKTYFVATSASTNLRALADVNHWVNFSFRIVLAITILDLLIETWKLLSPRLQTRSLVF
jgi:hypothetical protein